MNRSEKKDFVKKLKEELSSSSSVIVAHYSGITVDETDQLRKEMRNNGAKFKVTKNRLTKLALEDTQLKSLVDLFSGPTAIAYSCLLYTSPSPRDRQKSRMPSSA